MLYFDELLAADDFFAAVNALATGFMKENGLIMEFINWRVMGISFSPPPKLLKTVGRIEKWTGKRSIAL